MSGFHSGLTASIPVEDMFALIARLGAASGGSQALTNDTLRALGFVTKRYPMDSDLYWIVPGDDRHPLPPWCNKITASLDAALALAERVLPGCRCMAGSRGLKGDKARAAVIPVAGRMAGAKAHTPALALCIAILRATLDGCEAEGGVNKTSHATGDRPEKGEQT